MKYSKRKNLCLIYNYAQHYRTNIFKLMDRELHCDFIFGNNSGDIKKMDYSVLSNVKEVRNVRLIGPWYYQTGIISELNKYKKIFILGDVHCLSTWALLLLAHFCGTHIYFWTHGWYGKESGLVSYIKRIFNKKTDGVFLYGDYAKNLMIKEGFDKNQLHVIYNSLDYDNQIEIRKKIKNSNVYINHFNNDYTNLIFVGRLTEVKRLDLLVDSISLLNKRGCKVNLTLIGDGAKKQSLIDKVQELSLSDNVWFYGACYDENVLSSLIYNADLCVSPGNVGLTAIHSLTFGTPVITHDNFALQMPEFEAIEKGETGTFFKFGDLNSLTQTIIDWINNNKHSREKIRKKCYEVIDTKYNPYYQISVMKKHLL